MVRRTAWCWSATARAALNQDPTARISGSCTDLTCPLSGSTSTDPDGTITGYAWDFGDGDTGHRSRRRGTPMTRPAPTTVTLTVTDNQGGTDTATLEVEVTDAGRSAAQRGPGRGHHRDHLHLPHAAR